jgi:hypothetical protein
MRKHLLGWAFAGVVVGPMSATAFAQSPVFNSTTRPGKLNGAEPGSVQVNIGGTLFSGIWFEGGSGNSGNAERQSPNLLGYLRLYPNFDYQNPAGIHFGVSAEIRSQGAGQDVSRSTNTLYWHTASGYVTSPTFGKFEVGTPNDAIDQLGVGQGDDYGTGGFYSEYGWPNMPTWVGSDGYDGDNPKQKLAYISPALYGFTFALSYQPTSVGLNNNSNLLTVPPATSTGAASKNRVEVAAQFSRAFGPASVKANVGYATATAAPVAGNVNAYDAVSYFEAGAVVNFAGFELETQVNTGRFSVAANDGGNWGGPSLKGAKDTTTALVGVGYNSGPYSIGAQYYYQDFDAFDGGLVTTGGVGQTATVRGEALGAGYQVGPGVAVYFDGVTNQNRFAGQKSHGEGIGVGTYFSW